jgi:hypothetical protein
MHPPEDQSFWLGAPEQAPVMERNLEVRQP